MPPDIKQQYYDNRKIATGDLTPQEARIVATKLVQKQSQEQLKDQGFGLKEDEFEANVETLVNVLLGGNAMGGTPNRVNRAMGSGDDGELPADPTEPINPFKPKPIKPLGKMDVAMETQGQGNNVYDMLRARLPQEISDEVVKLISYNKEAFADFASIKNQEDVTSFNEKYGVELVIDVATV